MPMNLDIDTTDLERVERPTPRPLPPIDSLTLRSPFFVTNIPTTATVNSDAVRNFQVPQLPSYRITPPQPLTIAGSSTNATPTVTTSTFNILQPPAPTIAESLISITTGYEFKFNQVQLPLNSNRTISTYKVYRAPTNLAAKTVIRTIPHNPNNLGVPITVQDSVPNNIQQVYWVSAVNTAGIESSLTPAQGQGVTVFNTMSGFNSNSQVASSFHEIPVNVSNFPTSSTTLSNTGGSPNVALASSVVQFGAGTVAYNSGTVAPGTFGTVYVYAFDPTFAGGAAFYLQASTPVFQADDPVVAFGKIVTASGSSTTGGGFSGGTTPDGGAARGIII